MSHETLGQDQFAHLMRELGKTGPIGDAVVDEGTAGDQTPFGPELFTDTPDEFVRVGSLACVASMGTGVDETSTTPEYEYHPEQPEDFNPQQITELM